MKDLGSLLWALCPWEFWNAFVLVVGGIITVLFYVKDKAFYKETKTHSRQLLNTLPNIWTSLGIFGTFCAICISLEAFSAVEGEKEVGMGLITRLIGELIPAFSTSIWGIILAVVTTIRNKTLYNNEEWEEFQQLDSPEKNIKTLVELMREQQEQSRIYNEQLTTNILAQSEILKKFVNDFVDKMDVIFKKMEDSIEQQVKAFGESQFEQSREVVEAMTKKLSEVSTGLLEEQRDSVRTSLETTQTQLNGISASLTTMIGEISSSNGEAIKALTDSQNERLTLMLQNQEAISTKFLEDTTRGNEEMLVKMQQLGENFSSTCSEMLAKATEQNERVVTLLNESLSSVVTQITQAVKSECDGLAESITSVVAQLNSSYEFIDDHIAQIKSDYEQATLAYRDAVQNAHDNNESIENAIVRMDESLAAVEATNKNIIDILTLLENRQTNIDNLTQRIREIGEAIVTLQNLESTLNKLRG